MNWYMFSNLTGAPSQGYLQFLAERAPELNGKRWTDISFHPDERWLKVEYADGLTLDEQTAFEALIPQSCIDNKFILQEGEEYFEFEVDAKRWKKNGKRTRFQSAFRMPPHLEIYEADFKGRANLQVVDVSETGFHFFIGSSGARRSSGVQTVHYKWKAWTI